MLVPRPHTARPGRSLANYGPVLKQFSAFLNSSDLIVDGVGDKALMLILDYPIITGTDSDVMGIFRKDHTVVSMRTCLNSELQSRV